MLIRLLSLIIGMSLMTSCFSPIERPQINTYIINAIPKNIAKTTHPTALILLVNTPQTNPTYNTAQMAYVSEKYQLAYFAKNVWATSPSQMLLPLMVQTLENTQAFRAVIPASVNTKPDLILDTQLVQLQQEFSQQSSQVRLVMRAQLIQFATNEILKTQEFTIVEPTTAKNPYAGVVAINRATNKFLQQLAAFCIN